MACTSDAAAVDHIIIMHDLKQSFRSIESDATCLRLAMWSCGGGVVLAGLMLAHHLFNIPAFSFIWALVVSICS